MAGVDTPSCVEYSLLDQREYLMLKGEKVREYVGGRKRYDYR